MSKLLSRFYSVDTMVKPELQRGPLPTTKEAYQEVGRLALPSVIEMVLTSIVGTIDMMMVGILGSNSIAAVGLTSQPRMILLSIFFALNVGVTAIVARRRGEERKTDANQAFRNALLLSLLISIALMVPAILFAKEFMIFAGSSDQGVDTLQVIGEAATYFKILACVLPLNALTMSITAAQRGVGNTKLSMYVNMTSNVVNIVFNYLLINGNLGFPKLGVTGAAIATAIGFFAGFCMALFSVIGRPHRDNFLFLRLTDNWRFHKDSMKTISSVGGNAMLEQVAMRVGFFLYAKMVFSLGTVAFASHQIASQFLNISFTFGDGLAVASTALVGQYMGRERPDLSIIYGKVSQRIALTTSLILMTLVITLRYPLVSLYVSSADPNASQVTLLATQVMFLVAAFQPFQMSSVVISGGLRGAGDNRYVAAVMLICVVGIRLISSFVSINVFHLGLVAAWTSSLIDLIIRFSLVYRRFHQGKWMTIKI